MANKDEYYIKTVNLCCFPPNSVIGSEKNRFWFVSGSEKITVVFEVTSFCFYTCTQPCLPLVNVDDALWNTVPGVSSSMLRFSSCVC